MGYSNAPGGVGEEQGNVEQVEMAGRGTVILPPDFLALSPSSASSRKRAELPTSALHPTAARVVSPLPVSTKFVEAGGVIESREERGTLPIVYFNQGLEATSRGQVDTVPPPFIPSDRVLEGTALPSAPYELRPALPFVKAPAREAVMRASSESLRARKSDIAVRSRIGVRQILAGLGLATILAGSGVVVTHSVLESRSENRANAASTHSSDTTTSRVAKNDGVKSKADSNK